MIASATSRSGMCDVTRDVHKRAGDVELADEARDAELLLQVTRSSSSCVRPPRRIACLLSGANTMPSTSPRFAASAAVSSARQRRAAAGLRRFARRDGLARR